MKLEEHIHILKTIRVPFKSSLVRILWQIFEDHKDEIKSIEDLIKLILPPRREYPQPTESTAPRAVISVSELIAKAQAEGINVVSDRLGRPRQFRRPYRQRRPPYEGYERP